MSGHSPKWNEHLSADFHRLAQIFLNPCPSVLIRVPIFLGVPDEPTAHQDE